MEYNSNSVLALFLRYVVWLTPWLDCMTDFQVHHEQGPYDDADYVDVHFPIF